MFRIEDIFCVGLKKTHVFLFRVAFGVTFLTFDQVS